MGSKQNTVKRIFVNFCVWFLAAAIVLVYLLFKGNFEPVKLSEEDVIQLIDIKLVFTLAVSSFLLTGAFAIVKKDEREIHLFVKEELASLSINLGSMIFVSQIVLAIILIADPQSVKVSFLYLLIGVFCYILGYLFKSEPSKCRECKIV